MGVCEQLMLFEHSYGQHRSAQQRADMVRGGSEHRRFFLEGQAERRGRCFIATSVFGDGVEVAVLRSFRDRVLRSTLIGRAVIFFYYRTAPGTCRLIEGRPHLVWVMRALLRSVVWMAAKVLASRGGRSGD